jgi:hypothetical protein
LDRDTESAGQARLDTGSAPTPAEIEWRLRRAYATLCAVEHPDFALWPNTSCPGTKKSRLKQKPGGDIISLGVLEPRRALSMLLVDELRLIVYPLIAGHGSAFADMERRRGSNYGRFSTFQTGVSLIYGIG